MNRKRVFRKRIYLNSVTALLVRLLALFAAYALCRLIFYFYNHDAVGTILKSEWWSFLKGSFIFDSASIFYINIPFILLSLLPYRNRVNVRYQRVLSWIYIVPNSIALLTNIADIFFYGYRHGRITAVDFANNNLLSYLGSFISEYWWGILLWLSLCGLLYFISFVLVGVQRRYRLTYNLTSFYISQVIVCVLFTGYGLFAIRGHNTVLWEPALSVTDAKKYVRPGLEPLIQSNPFCVISTALEPVVQGQREKRQCGTKITGIITSGIYNKQAILLINTKNG